MGENLAIRINDEHSIEDCELEFTFARAQGPGGQNVNKVSTAVRLRFDAAGSRSLPEEARTRLLLLAGRRATASGFVVISSRRHRTQWENREDAVGRLVELVRKALEEPVERIPTEVPGTERERRRAEKRLRSGVKRARRSPALPDDREE
ncbi:aminoacyl-tRNA hydrolase [Candidatus Fermentibacteria bacterium]|nr:aminoacyl-tRNA hydrolase [Candidatus Fermentibacteria bacterium]